MKFKSIPLCSQCSLFSPSVEDTPPFSPPPVPPPCLYLAGLPLPPCYTYLCVCTNLSFK